MTIERITKTEIEAMDQEELQTLRNRFLQMDEKWFDSPHWPDLTKAQCLEKYRILCDELEKRKIPFIRKGIDRALFGVLAKEVSESRPVDISKPYPNYHSCQLEKPGKFTEGSIRTTTRTHDSKEYSVLMGKVEGEDTMTEQAYRYHKDTWDKADAKAHCKDHEGTFEPAKEVEKADPDATPGEKVQLSKFVKFVAVEKAESNPEHYVLGVVYEPDVKDSQNDWANSEEIRLAAFSFMESEQVYKINHDEKAEIHILESYLAPVDFEIGEEKVKKGSWLLGSRVVDDEVWKKIEEGVYAGYSMAGDSLRIETVEE